MREPRITAQVQPMLVFGQPLAPGDPAATQSFQAAVISNTNASPSGLYVPCWPYSYGLTTGVNQPLVVKWSRGPGESGVLDGDGAVEVGRGPDVVPVAPETVLFEAVDVGKIPEVDRVSDWESVIDSCLALRLLELELEESVDNALRDFSARGRCVWTFHIRARRYTVLVMIAVDDAS
jgi:hypothetical protein